MFNYDVDDERTFIVESAIKNKKGSKDEIELYEQLSIALELMQNEDFNVIGSQICNGINFNITTEFPNGLPEKVGTMFFNVDTKYDVVVCETPLYTRGVWNDPDKMNFSVCIKKR